MKLSIEKINAIKTIEAWYKFAPPEGGISQWVDGRSAKEFARYMLSEGDKMPDSITNYIRTIGWKILKCTCFPETVTSFPKCFGSGSGRHHDALLVSSDWIIGIEAKVSESFDFRIKNWLDAGLKNKDQGANRKKRICESLKLITGKTYSENMLSSQTIQNLRYQLISATAGIIIEARRRGLNKACFLVLEFGGEVVKEKKYDSNVEMNANDFEDYLDFLEISGRSDKERKIKIDESLTLWIKKIHINISSCEYMYVTE